MNLNFNKIIPSIIIGIILGLVLLFFTPEFSRLGVAFLFEIFCLLMLWVLDRYLLTKVDILKEIIERKNVALVLFILGLIAIPLLAS